MLSKSKIPNLLVAVAVALLLAGAAVAQQSPKKPEPSASKGEQEGTRIAPAGVLPTEALRLGADLEGAAPGVFLKWARKFAKREIVDRSEPPTQEAVGQGLQAAFPKAPATSREAGEILLWYLAYQQGAKTLEIAASRVRELERDMGYVQDELQRHRSTPVPIQQAAAAREAEDRLLATFEQVTRQRDLHKRVADMIRARVDFCIERLAAANASSRERDPEAIKALK